jgi:hypothetical protein
VLQGKEFSQISFRFRLHKFKLVNHHDQCAAAALGKLEEEQDLQRFD